MLVWCKMRTKQEILKDMVQTCGLRYVGTRGNPNDGVCFVGEAPGADEERLWLPFVGASGKELGRMCKDSGWPGTTEEVDKGAFIFSPHDVWFTNVFKVRPPENKIARIEEYGIPVHIFVEAFFEELRQYRPTIIVATGNTSLGYLCPFTRGKDGQARIGTYKGSLLTSKLLDWPHYVIPCYHPAFILRQWDERPTAVFCLERALEEWRFFKANGSLNPLPKRKFSLQPIFDWLVEFLTGLVNYNTRISVDIETLEGSPTVYGIATSPWEATSFSLWDYPEDYRAKIWRLLNQALKVCPQIGQNYVSFDCSYHELIGMEPDLRIFESKTDDTLVMHHVLWPEFPHKLEFLCMQYTREPYYKDEGRRWKPKDGIRQLMHYNALDAAVTYEVFLAMKAELIERSNLCPQLRTTMIVGNT